MFWWVTPHRPYPGFGRYPVLGTCAPPYLQTSVFPAISVFRPKKGVYGQPRVLAPTPVGRCLGPYPCPGTISGVSGLGGPAQGYTVSYADFSVFSVHIRAQVVHRCFRPVILAQTAIIGMKSRYAPCCPTMPSFGRKNTKKNVSLGALK